MAKYPCTSLDYRLQNGQEFSVTVCGYSGKVRYLTIGTDTLRFLRRHFVDVTESRCEDSRHCLATKCSLNQTPPEHLAHMLEMQSDELLDEETAKICGTKSTIDFLVEFTDKMSEILPQELRERQETY